MLFSITPEPPSAATLVARSISFCASTESVPAASTSNKNFADRSSSLIILATIIASVAIGPPRFPIILTTLSTSPTVRSLLKASRGKSDKI